MGSGEDIHIEQDGTKVIKFGFTHDNGASGWVIRSFHPEKKHLEFRDSYFDDKLPRLMRHDGEMIEGKGTPAIAYMDMLAMRRLGVGYGELRTATICSVHDLDSALQLEWLQRHLEQKPLSELVSYIRIYRSRETSIVSSGHTIISAEVHGGEKEIIDEFLSPREKYKYRDLLDQYELKRTDAILWRFDINLRVKPTHSDA